MQVRALATVTAAALALSLGACSSDGSGDGASAADGPITLEYWAWGTAQDGMVEAWNRTHPDVQVRKTDAGGSTDSSAKLLTATRAENAPDVAVVQYDTLPAMIVGGVAADIGEHVADAEEQFNPGVWSQVEFDGAVYGVPQDVGPQALVYNQARFTELGLPVPTTWAEFAAVAEQVEQKDPAATLTTFAPAEFGGFAAMAQQNGAQWWTVDGDAWTVSIDDEPSRRVAQYWEDLVDRGVIDAQPLLTPEWNARLAAGEVLSWPSALWANGVVNGVVPEQAGQWALAPIPQWEAGRSAVSFQGGSAVVVTTSSEHPEEAAEFAEWINTSKEGSAAQIEAGQYPASLVGQELTLSSAPPVQSPQQADYWQVAQRIASDTVPEVSWGPNVNVASSAFQDAFNAAATRGTSFTDALAAVQEAVVADMEKSGFTVSAG
ncbi:ABC transporter substrate-binding protein [Kineococcus indalonis]|uniref:ABC transporter substrate-binding protein n=1 Tax=Kineococcus indalonis TaxID=2696566 RepID=UPI001412A0BF|nr:extracellular solute-binding protein [Kineococcus indalonis]NAZ85320.1 extracellular solute-binding protein [Kineococcus indalonis]